MQEIKNSVRFRQRPSPIFPSYRPMLRIAQILLVLFINSRGKKASLLKLHLFSWAFKSDENLSCLKSTTHNQTPARIDFVTIEPTLNRALIYAQAESLIQYDGKNYLLLARGEKYAKACLDDKTLFENELPLLKIIGISITEKRVAELENLWKNA